MVAGWLAKAAGSGGEGGAAARGRRVDGVKEGWLSTAVAVAGFPAAGSATTVGQ